MLSCPILDFMADRCMVAGPFPPLASALQLQPYQEGEGAERRHAARPDEGKPTKALPEWGLARVMAFQPHQW